MFQPIGKPDSPAAISKLSWNPWRPLTKEVSMMYLRPLPPAPEFNPPGDPFPYHVPGIESPAPEQHRKPKPLVDMFYVSSSAGTTEFRGFYFWSRPYFSGIITCLCSLPLLVIILGHFPSQAALIAWGDEGPQHPPWYLWIWQGCPWGPYLLPSA